MYSETCGCVDRNSEFEFNCWKKNSQMKFINYLETITGIGIFPFLSLMIFFLFFSGVIIYAFAIRKDTIEELKSIPLQNNNENDEPENF